MTRVRGLVGMILVGLNLVLPASAASLTPYMFVNHYYTCTVGQNVPVEKQIWINPTNNVLRIHKLLLWHGTEVNKFADLWIEIRRASDDPSNFLARNSYDRYANPSEPIHIWFDYSPIGIQFGPGESLITYMGCRAWKAGTHHHVIGIVYLEGL